MGSFDYANGKYICTECEHVQVYDGPCDLCDGETFRVDLDKQARSKAVTDPERSLKRLARLDFDDILSLGVDD